MKINYLTEIKMFNEWLETNELSTSGIALWYAMMYVAYRSGRMSELNIPISVLCLRTKTSRSAIYRERENLRNYGLIDFESIIGRQSCNYRIIGFEERLISHTGTQAETFNGETSLTGTLIGETPQETSHTETQAGTFNDETSHTGTLTGETSHKTSHTGTQRETFNDKNECEMSHTETFTPERTASEGDFRDEKNEKLPIYINKDRYKDKRGSGGKKKKSEFDLSFIDDAAWESLVRTWLDYKHSRREDYKSELSARKFLTMLRNYSGGNPTTAQKIIDKSIANNWAGIFELSHQAGSSAMGNQINRSGRCHPATGQRIGQIIQPVSDDKRKKLLDKFGRGACPERNGGNDSDKNSASKN